MAVLSLITSQDGQERETPERMPLRRARRRPVCWIEANISAMSYHQPYTRLPIFVLSYFLSLSLSIPRLSLLLFVSQPAFSPSHPSHTLSNSPCPIYVCLCPLPLYPFLTSSLPGGRALS